MLTQSCRSLIENWRLGYVATVNADGTPNLSPKGTFVVHDEKTLGFAMIRSPQTLANLTERPHVAVNFCDLLSRRGLRIEGQAGILRASDAAFPRFIAPYRAEWSTLAQRMKALVLIEITRAEQLTSPVYDDYETVEDDLRAHWMQHIKNTYIANRFAGKHPC